MPSYNTLNEIIEKFNKVNSEIRFEGREYKYVNIIFEKNVKKLVYRCEREQHNLVVSMMGDVVVNAEGVYSIGDVAV
ncbi:hypothetical protein H9636_07200 [Ureibacillus sp. Re31]|uniref:Uncharacterized protein n=1 Tax=Ureibacillus galli TaxID=2762222 RepID=A0ABR8XAV2_9BACL|nr:hypothetical protein [Ureibacillus galli]MBD8026444.1 hypothetical protein [Ureibacillus galli]